MWCDVFLVRIEHLSLDCGVADEGYYPADYEKYYAPGHEVGGDEHEACGCEAEKEEG